jgi:hypothetical protein
MKTSALVAVNQRSTSFFAETINGPRKAEVIHRRGPWRSFEAVEFATLEWVDWFNNRRLLEPIGNIPPAEAEERYYAALVQSQLPTAILRSDGARRAFPRHLPSLKNSESMSAWIGVICRSSAKSN